MRKKQPPTPRITAAICTYDRYDLLPKAVESLAQQTLPHDRFRILVVDNSPDVEDARKHTKAYAKVPNLTYVVERRAGLSNARNLAVHECGTELIAFMDDDATAEPRWLEEILAAFDKFGSNTGIVGGRVDPAWSLPRPAWLHDRLLGYLSVVDWGGRARVAKPSEWFAGTNVAFRTRAIVDHGGFSPHLGRIGSGAALLSNEEVQLITRIRAAGHRLVYAPKAVVDHYIDASRLTRTWFRKRAAWQATSDYIMDPQRLAKHGSKLWNDTLQYLNALPAHERGLRGLVLDTDDPELFWWQTNAIYMMTAMSLSGFDGVSAESF